MALLHRKRTAVSHYQVALFGAAYPEPSTGLAMVVFGGEGVAVATAWDENGRAEPIVDVAVHGFDLPPFGIEGLSALADGTIASTGTLTCGNAVTNDLTALAMPQGILHVLVAADTREPFQARRVAFHLWRAA